MKLTQLRNIPYHPDLAKWFGYAGDRAFVAFHWCPGGDLTFDDGHIAASTGNWRNWLDYLRHPRVMVHVQGYDFGSDEDFGGHQLLLDLAKGAVYVGGREAVEAFLHLNVCPPPKPVEVSQEGLEALGAAMEKAIHEGFHRVVPASKDRVQEHMRHEEALRRSFEVW